MQSFRNGVTVALLLFLLLLGWTLPFGKVEGRNILSVEFVGGKSHVITYLPLLEELARRGDNVTLISPSQGLTKEANIHQIFSLDGDAILKENPVDPFAMLERNEAINLVSILARSVPKRCREMYDRPEIEALYEQDFDLVLLQYVYNECALGFVDKILTKNGTKSTAPPLIVFSVLNADYRILNYVGGNHPSSFVSNPYLDFNDKMTFSQRLVNFGANHLHEAVRRFYYLPAMEAVYKDKLGRDAPSVAEVLSKTALVLSNGHFSTSPPRPNLPNVVEVGGMHSRKAKRLPKEIENFLSSGNRTDDDGFILFSLGTNLLSSAMSVQKKAMLLNVFSRLKQKVIWKYESDDIENVPKNVYLSKWIPQQDLLGHPKIRLFITHCGAGGIEEAIFHGVPLIGIPFFGDQPLNALTAERQGFLVRLEWKDVTEERLIEAINEVINNSKYRDNVKRLSTIFRDQIDNPLDRALFWVEYVMRHNGAPHLRSAARNLSLIQYHSLDVIAAYAVIIFALFFLLFVIAKHSISFVTYWTQRCPKMYKYKST
ncbi:UDP-glucuronosyltransferase 2B14 [Folsomia candida]|nr:UDP-glucuronosyltransferase 2B14 [Folsomia candida]